MSKKKRRFDLISDFCMQHTCKECRHKCRVYLSEEKKEKERERNESTAKRDPGRFIYIDF